MSWFVRNVAGRKDFCHFSASFHPQPRQLRIGRKDCCWCWRKSCLNSDPVFPELKSFWWGRAENHSACRGQDPKVQPRRPCLAIVILDPEFAGEDTRQVHLLQFVSCGSGRQDTSLFLTQSDGCQAGNAGPHVKHRRKAFGGLRYRTCRRRSWSNKAHVANEHIPELWQFVDMPMSEDTPQTRRSKRLVPAGRQTVVTATHRAQFPHQERGFRRLHPLGAKKRRMPIDHGNQDSTKEDNRRRPCEEHGRHCNIENALGHRQTDTPNSSKGVRTVKAARLRHG